MNRRKKVILFLVIFLGVLSLTNVSWAANHYVTPSGSGSKAGSDWNNAYQGLPAALTRGDTYYIADGSYGGYTCKTPISGSSYITIKKATASDHGSEIGWQSSYGDGQATFSGMIEFTSSYWVFDGVTGGGPGSWGSGYGFKVTETSDSNAVIRVGFTTGANYITVRHVDAQGKGSVSTAGGWYSNDGLGIYSTSNSTFSYIWLHGIGRCPIFLPGGANGNPYATFEYLYVTSFYGSGPVHSTLMSTGQDTMGDVTFRYSLVTDLQSTGGLMWDNHLTAGTYLYVYGNVFYRPSGSTWSDANGVIGGWAGGGNEDCYGLRIYNNTFININISHIFTNFQIRYGDNIAYNNLFYNDTSPQYDTIPTHDYNHYINSGGTHSETHGTSATSGDPFVDYVNLDFRLKADTTAGTSLPSPFNLDLLGNTRGADGTWDRGAYEYVCSPLLYGDVSGDGSISAYDASLAAQYAVGLITLTPDQINKADVSGDGGVSAYDASLIAQRAVGLIDKFPVEGK